MSGFRSLGAFLAELERRGDLLRVDREVDWECEVTEIACREAKAEGPALLFEKVRGASFPLAVNVLGARRRIEWAIGRTPGSVGAELEEILHAVPPRRLSDLWRLRGSAGRALAMRPRVVGQGPAQAHALPDLGALPILQLWPNDGGRFVTFPLVLTEHPQTKARNLGIYRMHVYDAKTTGMHWQIGKGGGFHHHRAEKLGRDLEVAVAVGADPATLLSSVAPLPEGIDELAFAGFLRGAPTRLARARTLSMAVPADAEFVLEGVVRHGERRVEGPFGDHFGHYSHAAPFPVFHLGAITHRERPVFQASVVGKPPQEDKFMGEAVQEFFAGVLKVIHPEVRDLWAYFEAGFHNLLVVAVENRFAKEGMKTALGLMGTGQLSLTKAIVLVDDDVNPRDRAAVFGAIARHFDPAEDFLLLPRVPLDTLDFTSYTMNLGSKMILDAMSKPGREPRPGLQPLPDPRAFDDRITAHRLAWQGLLAVRVRGEGRSVIENLVRRPEYANVPLVAAVSADVPLDDDELLLWGVFTRFDCARDIVPARVETRGAWLTSHGPLGIDATWKDGYPDPVATPAGVIAKVDGWWRAAAPAGGRAMTALRIGGEVRAARARHGAIVALETTLVTHGFPPPRGLEVARRLEAIVREGGATPATIGVLDGAIVVGATAAELERLAAIRGAAKLNPSNLAACVARGDSGSTTVAATALAAEAAGLAVFATGGIGGVHRGDHGDESADLTSIARHRVAVVCAGAKAILDLPRTVERLETLGVPVLGFRTDRFPAFYRRDSGLPVDARCDDADALAAAVEAHFSLGLGGVIVANPIPEADELPAEVVDPALAEALAEGGARGRDVTPRLLERLRERTGGRSVEANVALLENNARLAAALASALARRRRPGDQD